MEIVFIVSFLLLILIIFVSRSDSASKPDPTPKEQLPSETASRRVARAMSRPTHFDAKTSTPQPVHTRLKGRAYVVDGDTIVIEKTQIRLFGVDAPEMNHPYGKKAKWALVNTCKGQQVIAEISDTDAHGRTVARCFLPDGRDLSAEMVKVGLAIDWPKFSGGVYKSFEVPDARKKMWLADARQKGRMHVWEQFEAKQKARAAEG